MNKKEDFKRITLIISFILILLLLGGCGKSAGPESFYELTVPMNRLREIETLNLEDMDGAVPGQSEVEETPPQELELTLEQSRGLALENNLDLKTQLISPSIAAEAVNEEEAKFEAAFYAGASYIKTDTPTVTTLTGSQVEASNVNLGVQIPLRTGGELVFNLADNRIKTDNIFSTLDPAYTSDFSVSISQPLLRNAGKRVNTHSIRIVNYDRQIIDARTKLEVIRVITAVDRVYWRLYAAIRELDVRKKEYELAQAQLSRAERFVDAGQRPQIEVVRAQAGLAQRLEAIILGENAVRDRQRELKRALNKPGLSMETLTVLVCATEPDPVHYDLNAGELTKLAIDNRMEMLELELRIAQDISTIDYLGNQLLPLITLDYTYNVNGLGPTRNNSFDMLYHKNFEDHRAGFQLLVPLGNQAAKSRLLQAFYV